MNHDGSSFFRFVQRPLGGIPHFRHIMTHPNGMMQVSTNGMMLKGSGKLAMEPWFLSLLHSGYIAGLSPWTPLDSRWLVVVMAEPEQPNELSFGAEASSVSSGAVGPWTFAAVREVCGISFQGNMCKETAEFTKFTI